MKVTSPDHDHALSYLKTIVYSLPTNQRQVWIDKHTRTTRIKFFGPFPERAKLYVAAQQMGLDTAEYQRDMAVVVRIPFLFSGSVPAVT